MLVIHDHFARSKMPSEINFSSEKIIMCRETVPVLASVISIFTSASGGGLLKHFAKQFGAASENMLFFLVFYSNRTRKVL